LTDPAKPGLLGRGRGRRYSETESPKQNYNSAGKRDGKIFTTISSITSKQKRLWLCRILEPYYLSCHTRSAGSRDKEKVREGGKNWVHSPYSRLFVGLKFGQEGIQNRIEEKRFVTPFKVWKLEKKEKKKRKKKKVSIIRIDVRVPLGVQRGP